MFGKEQVVTSRFDLVLLSVGSSSGADKIVRPTGRSRSACEQGGQDG